MRSLAEINDMKVAMLKYLTKAGKPVEIETLVRKFTKQFGEDDSG